MASMLGDLKKHFGAATGPTPTSAAPQAATAMVPQPPQPEPPAPPPQPEPRAKGRWAAAPSLEEIAGYLMESAPRVPADDEEVMISDHAGVFLALEGGVVVPHACIAVRGWVADEAGKVHSLYLHWRSELRPLHRIAHIYRGDVNAFLKPVQQGYRAGFSAVEPIDNAPPGPVAVYLVAIVEDAEEFHAVISARQILLSQGHHLDRLADELGTSWISPEEMERLANPYLRRLANAVRELAWPDQQVEVIGSVACDATIILVVDRNIDMLAPVLAFLEMRPNHRRLGVVVVFSRPDHAERGVAVVRALRSSSGFAFIKLLNPSSSVTFGAAVNRALEIAEGEGVIVCADGVLPPAHAWIEPVLELSRQNPDAVLVPALMTFDGRPDTLEGLADELPLDRFECDHTQALAEVIRDAHGLGRLGAGVVAAQREFLVGAQVFDDSFTSADFTFADAYRRLAARDPSSLRPLDLVFTTLTLPEHYVSNPSVVLWNVYALRASLRQARQESSA